VRIVDLTHPFTASMPVYPGDPPSRLQPVAEYEGAPLYAVTTGMHAGTHLDAPLHFFPSAENLAAVPLDRFIGPGVLLDGRGRAELGEELLAQRTLPPGAIALILTGWSARFRQSDYYEGYPVVTEELAAHLIEAGVKILALDTPSPDRAPYPIHRALLGRGILLAENLTNLEALLGVPEFEVIALPVSFEAEAAPARIIARFHRPR
jgi:kynurenine formamidase